MNKLVSEKTENKLIESIEYLYTNYSTIMKIAQSTTSFITIFQNQHQTIFRDRATAIGVD